MAYTPLLTRHSPTPAPTADGTSPPLLPTHRRHGRQTRRLARPLRLPGSPDRRGRAQLDPAPTTRRRLPRRESTDQLRPHWGDSHDPTGSLHLHHRRIPLHPARDPEPKPLGRHLTDPHPALHLGPHVQPYPARAVRGRQRARRDQLFCRRVLKPVRHGDADCRCHV